MAFRKTMSAESVTTVTREDGEQIRKVVKQAGVKSAAELDDAGRKKLPR